MNKTQLMIIFVAVVGAISAMSMHDKLLAPFMNGPTKELFKAYHEVFGKEYDLNTEEGLRRYRIFKDNLNYIRQENAKGHEYKLGITPFADMTNEEYRQKVLRPEAEFMQDIIELSEQTAPFLSGAGLGYTPGAIKVDWTSKFGAVKNQGKCGSCWAFATFTSIEGNYNIKTGQSIVTGPQQLVDCDTSNGGCEGGWPTNAYAYTIKNGVALEADYPYKAVKSTCTYNATKGLKIVTEQKQCPMGRCAMDTWVSMIQQGPMQVVVDAGSQGFQLYKSGVVDLAKCGNANHAVTAVALLNGDGFDYIRILNSWSAGWGDKGFMSVKYNASNQSCHVTETGWLPVVQANPSPNPNPNPNPDPNPSPTPVISNPTFYTECNYQGSNVSSNSSLKSFALGSALDLTRRINSVKTTGYDVTIYENVNCTGRAFRFPADEPCFSTSTNVDAKNAVNNAVSASIVAATQRPKNGCIAVFSDNCFSGTRQEICGDLPNLASLGFDNKTVSIQLGTGVVGVAVFIDPNYDGLAFGLTKSYANLGQDVTKLFNNSISSLKIFKQ